MQQSDWSVIDCRPLWGISVRLQQATVSCCKELHCQQLSPWALSHVFLIFKGVVDLPQACIKTGRTKMRPDTAGLEETAFRVWKGLHLVYLLSWKFWVWLRGLPGSKPDGKVWGKKEQSLSRGVSGVGKQLPWHGPRGMQRAPVPIVQRQIQRAPRVWMERAAGVTAPGGRAWWAHRELAPSCSCQGRARQSYHLLIHSFIRSANSS